MRDSESIKKLTFEEALHQLEEIVQKIDSGQEDLAQAVESFEHGILLKKHCDSLLKEAKLKIDKITKTADGVKTSEADI